MSKVAIVRASRRVRTAKSWCAWCARYVNTGTGYETRRWGSAAAATVPSASRGVLVAEAEAVQQAGSAVLIQGEEPLHLLNFCLHAGAQKMRRDGLSAARIEQLKTVVRRALMSAQGHKLPNYVLSEANSAGQEMWSIRRAALELEISPRQVRRIARNGIGTRSGRDWFLPKGEVLALKLDRDWKARNGSRNADRVA
jgi:hypothetical protein